MKSKPIQLETISALPTRSNSSNQAPSQEVSTSLSILDADPPSRDALSKNEWSELRRCEAEISEAKVALRAAWRAVESIRDKKLHRGRYPTFVEYCWQIWGRTRRAVDIEIQVGRTVDLIEKENPGSQFLKVLKSNPGLARGLIGVSGVNLKKALELLEAKCAQGTKFNRKFVEKIVADLKRPNAAKEAPEERQLSGFESSDCTKSQSENEPNLDFIFRLLDPRRRFTSEVVHEEGGPYSFRSKLARIRGCIQKYFDGVQCPKERGEALQCIKKLIEELERV